VNELNPTDITYVHSVYAPLSVRLVEVFIFFNTIFQLNLTTFLLKNCISPGWRSIKDVLDLLSGPSFEEQLVSHKSLFISLKSLNNYENTTYSDFPYQVTTITTFWWWRWRWEWVRSKENFGPLPGWMHLCWNFWWHTFLWCFINFISTWLFIISALRFLSQQEDAPTEYLVATTAIITGDRLIESLMTNVEKSSTF